MWSSNLMRWGKIIQGVTNIQACPFNLVKKSKPSPLGRWIVNDNNWEIRAEYATSDSCGGNLCSKTNISSKKNNHK